MSTPAWLVVMAVCVATWSGARGQEAQQPQSQAGVGSVTTVHGVVRSGASGDVLPRALVRIVGDATTGVLTDGEGRFEIPGVPLGPQMFEVVKPGFIDHEVSATDTAPGSSHSFAHNVIVSALMGDLGFIMDPVNSIRGQIQLSSGDAADGIHITLLKRTVQDGRVAWQPMDQAKTNSEGVYRFGDLADGQYAVFTEPAMDSDAATNLVEHGNANNVVREGYASVFYPDARDLAGAAKIRLSGGEQAQANIVLTLEPFHAVTASVVTPRAKSPGDENVSVQVLDGQGRQLPYSTQYDAATHTVQTWLPDGTYSLLATETTRLLHVLSSRTEGAISVSGMGSPSITGEVAFAVAGRALQNLRIPLSPAASSRIQVTIQRGANATPHTGETRVFIALSQTGGWMADGMVNNFTEGPATSVLEGTPPAPGSYWVHTSIAPKALCEASFTAGGASLAREPLTMGVGGTAVPLVLTLRDDCAKLTLTLPDSVGLSAGEERYYTVFVVPDFDSTEDVVPQTLRPSSGGRITLGGLTPGSYRVYAFEKSVALEYRNPEVLGGIPSQSVTLPPGGVAELTLEVPQR